MNLNLPILLLLLPTTTMHIPNPTCLLQPSAHACNSEHTVPFRHQAPLSAYNLVYNTTFFRGLAAATTTNSYSCTYITSLRVQVIPVTSTSITLSIAPSASSTIGSIAQYYNDRSWSEPCCLAVSIERHALACACS